MKLLLTLFCIIGYSIMYYLEFIDYKKLIKISKNNLHKYNKK